MATSKQEEIYNEIVEYYGYADRLIRAVEDSNHELSGQQFSIVEELTTCLEDCADKLSNQYIEFVKNGESEEVTSSVRQTLNEISTKIQECRNKVKMMKK
jgi:gas vesicle protein